MRRRGREKGDAVKNEDRPGLPGGTNPFAGKPFIEPGSVLGGSIVRGRVVDVQQTTTFPTPFGKAVRAWAGGGYMFGHQWLKTALYVQPADDDSGQVERCLLFYGDLAGAVRAGNLVEARVRSKGGRLVVRQLNNVTTQSAVREEDSMGCWLAVVLAVMALLFGALILAGLQSGVLVALLAEVALQICAAALQVIGVLLSAFGPVIVLTLGIALAVKALFR